MLGTPPAFVLSQDQTLVFNPFESQKLSLPSSKLILELTVFSQLRLVKIAVRVLLDSVSFSRIIRCLLGLVVRADSLIIISQSRSPVNTFFELFLTLFESFCLKSASFTLKSVIFLCYSLKNRLPGRQWKTFKPDHLFALRHTVSASFRYAPSPPAERPAHRSTPAFCRPSARRTDSP